MDTVDSLTQKLLAAYGAQHQLERLRLRAVPGFVRLLEGARSTMPLGMIPITLVWTAVVFFLPYVDPMKLIRLYALGLCGMLVVVGALLGLRALSAHLKLKDSILGEMTMLSGLAFHPNTTLRRSVSARGYATLGEFHAWYLKQREILDTRVADFDQAIAAAKRTPKSAPDLSSFPPGARAFLES